MFFLFVDELSRQDKGTKLRGLARVGASKCFNVIGFPGIIRQLLLPSVYPAFTVIFRGVALRNQNLLKQCIQIQLTLNVRNTVKTIF